MENATISIDNTPIIEFHGDAFLALEDGVRSRILEDAQVVLDEAWETLVGEDGLAVVAYEASGIALGTDLRPWTDLTEEARSAWRSSAQAVVNALAATTEETEAAEEVAVADAI